MVQTPFRLSSVAALALAAAGSAQQSPVFDAPVIAVADAQQRMNALLDLDGDGWTDAVGTFWPNDDEGAVFGFLNDGTGRLEPLFEDRWTQYGDNDMAFPVEAADLTGDGKDDFVVGLRDELRIYQSAGAGAPTLLHSVHTGSGNEIQDLVIGDYDGDGALEVAVRMMSLNGSNKDRGVAIYDGVLTGPQQAEFFQPVPGTGYVLKNVEANGDGVVDLACIGNIVTLLSMAGGSLGSAGVHVIGLGSDSSGDAGDVDGDGDEDLVVFAMAGQYRVLRRQGPAVFALEPAQFGGPATGLADVDADGDLDGVCCGGGGGNQTFYNTSKSHFELALNDGTGSFLPSFQLPALGSNEIAGVGDLDRDGDADLIAGRVVYYNQGGFAPLASLSATKVEPGVLADVDGDGDPDVHASHQWFERNRADGLFEAWPRIAPPPPAGSTFGGPGVQADFDGDGDVDLIVPELQGGLPTNERLLSNTGGGGLVDSGPATAAGVVFADSPDFRAAYTGDVNGDGRTDVLAVDSSQTGGQFTTRVYTQAPDGTFALTTTLPGEAVSLIADIDADGMDDLVTVDSTDLWLRFGDPAAAFSAVQTVYQPVGNYSYSDRFAAGDLNGDGTLDLVVTRHQGGTNYDSIRILDNQGGRQFAVLNSVLPGVHVLTARFTLADVDADGDLDLLLDSRYDPVEGNTLQGTTIYPGGPGISFGPAGPETYPTLSALADVDGDGDLDGAAYMQPDYGVFENATLGSDDSGARLQFGTATPGLGGQEPTLGAVGPFVAGGTIQIRVTGAAPGAPGRLFVGTASGGTWSPILGATLEVSPIIELPFTAASATGEWGSGAFALDVQVPLTAAGKTLYFQAQLFDAAGQGGGAVTNALRLDFAP